MMFIFNTIIVIISFVCIYKNCEIPATSILL